MTAGRNTAAYRARQPIASERTSERSFMTPANDVKIKCPTCFRRASPQLRAVASGLLAVCPYCLSPYLPERRGQGAFRRGTDAAAPMDASKLEARPHAARGKD